MPKSDRYLIGWYFEGWDGLAVFLISWNTEEAWKQETISHISKSLEKTVTNSGENLFRTIAGMPSSQHQQE